MKIISFEDIQKLDISPYVCYEWVEKMIKEKASVLLPPKVHMEFADDIFCNVMPSAIQTEAGTRGGVKIVTRYPERIPSLDSKVILFDAETGEFLAMMDGDWITAMRTGAVAAHSIKLFAVKDFYEIGMLGLGNTARAALLVLLALYPEKTLHIKLLRYKGQEQLFAHRFKEYSNVEFTFVDTMEETVRGSDVVISAVTYFKDDICTDDCFKEGVLIVPIHTRGFMNCDLFFDKIYGDDRGHVCHFKYFDKYQYFAEVSDVVNQKALGRENDRERIIAYNIGLSMHDINYASHIYEMLKDNKGLLDIEFKSPKEKFWL